MNALLFYARITAALSIGHDAYRRGRNPVIWTLLTLLPGPGILLTWPLLLMLPRRGVAAIPKTKAEGVS